MDLIDSNEAMIVLTNLPNVQMLNGKSTKDDEEEEEEATEGEGEGEYEANKDNTNNSNDINNNHLYSKMEKIDEDKNSNFISENNSNEKNEKSHKINEINSSNEAYDNELIKQDNEDIENNKNVKEKELNINSTGGFKPNTLLLDKIISNDSNSNNAIELNSNLNSEPVTNKKNKRIDRERESIFDLNNYEKNGKKVIDITNEELESLKEDRYSENSDFVPLMKEFCILLNNNEENSDGERLQNTYFEKIKAIEEKKSEMPKYYYFYLLFKKKIKIIQNMFNELVPFIIEKCPDLNSNNILERLVTELFNTVKDSKELISNLHSHIDEYNPNKNNENENEINALNEIIKQKDNKILSLEKSRNKLLNIFEEEKASLNKKIASLEKENRIMTENLLKKAKNSEIERKSPDTETYIVKQKNQNNANINNSGFKSKKVKNENKKIIYNNDTLNTHNSKSPMKLTEYTNTYENNNLNTNYQFNSNNNKQQLISLKTLKDFINELYLSKAQYDIKCTQFKLPKETLEEYMYTFLNKKYGLKNLIIEWAKNIINGIKYYSKKDSFVLLFGKIMRNEQEEDSRFIIQKISESIEELLLYYIKRQNPLKLINEIKNIFEKKKKSELYEEEWKGIIYSIYEKGEAEEIENKIINFINKENQRKKIEMFKKYKDSRMNSKNVENTKNNYYINTNNTINSFQNNTNNAHMNTIGNINSNNKLSRVEKYNILLFSEDKNILYPDFIKIVLDNHIRFRDKQLKKFVDLFKSVDTNKDGIINEEQFSELVKKMEIFKEDEVENKIFQFLEKIDPFDSQKFTFSECISFFSSEMIKESDENDKEISILEKVCLDEKDKNKSGNNEVNENNNNENNQGDQLIESGIEHNKNIDNNDIQSNDVNNNEG